MLREIHIDNFSKVITNYKPEIFNALTVLEARPYSQHVELYSAYDQQQTHYQVYSTEKELEPILKDIEFLQNSPKILLVKTEKDHIIIEEQVEESLYELLLALESRSTPAPYLEESAARAILRSLQPGLENYRSHEVNYNAINPRNIVRRGLEWELSLTGLLLRNEKDSPDYYKADVKREYLTAYALGTLLFKLLFGFVPFEKRKERSNFAFKDYLKYLDREETKKALKIYYFADRLLEVSEKAKQLIELALRGDVSFEEFYSHEYFSLDTLLGARKELNPANRQIKMLGLFPTSQQSLVMAAIEHHRKYPQERINSKLIFAHELSKEEIIAHLKKHPVLCEVQFDESFRQSKVKESLRVPVKELPKLHIQYFNREDDFDPESDFPCRDLIKFIERYRQEWESEESFERAEAAIKLYAYPYAMIFELLKVAKEQPEEIIERIYKLIEDLLQVSQLKHIKLVEPLHQTELIIKSFEEIKLRFRESINYLYKYFLSEAIKKYNVKKELMQYAERSKYKRMGLEYYKLCLKLMQCSLLIRKEGRELDLNRIETSERKEVESDLNQLLKQYFPNKIELN